METNENTRSEVLNNTDHDVIPEVLLGWLRAVIEDGGVIDAAEWNKAITTLSRKA